MSTHSAVFDPPFPASPESNRDTPLARVTLTKWATGGDALGHLPDGRAVFVPFGAPGDEALIAIQKTHRTYARGRLHTLLVPSPVRVAPVCPLAAPPLCGGCPLMHVSLAAQRAAKQDFVSQACRHSSGEVLPILSPVPSLGYRLRAKWQVVPSGLSFSSAQSSARQKVDVCPVLVDALNETVLGRLSPVWELAGVGSTVCALSGQASGQASHLAPVHVAIEQMRAVPTEKSAALRKTLEEAVEAGVLAGAMLDDTEIGSQAVLLDAAHAPLFASADGFAQASEAGHTLLPELVRHATQAGFADDGSVLELFAGSGNLTRALCVSAKRVVAVEGGMRAARRLAELCAHVPHAETLALSVSQALRTLAAAQKRFEVVVLDPPRGGAKDELPLLADVATRRIVYVSCDTATLGRDLRDLSQRGFAVKTVQPIDLMPHTAEVECVAVLDRV